MNAIFGGATAVFAREMMILGRRLPKMLGSWSVSPLLYMIAFGYAMGDALVEGREYREFLLPGLIAMSSMTQAWAIASEINISRFYWRIFEEFQSAPITPAGYVAGEVLAAVVRVLLSVSVIMVIGLVFGVRLVYWSPLLWLAVVMNAWFFASIGAALAMLVKSHADQAMMTSFIITPMAFLGGTFFPLDRLPAWAREALHLLPLTHAAKALRAAAFGQAPALSHYLLLGVLGALTFALAVWCVGKARE